MDNQHATRVRLPQYGTSRIFESAGMDNYHATRERLPRTDSPHCLGPAGMDNITPRVSAYHNMAHSGSTQRVRTIITTTVSAYHNMGRLA